MPSRSRGGPSRVDGSLGIAHPRTVLSSSSSSSAHTVLLTQLRCVKTSRVSVVALAIRRRTDGWPCFSFSFRVAGADADADRRGRGRQAGVCRSGLSARTTSRSSAAPVRCSNRLILMSERVSDGRTDLVSRSEGNEAGPALCRWRPSTLVVGVGVGVVVADACLSVTGRGHGEARFEKSALPFGSWIVPTVGGSGGGGGSGLPSQACHRRGRRQWVGSL